MFDLGGVRDRADFNKRLAVTAVLLVAYRLGTHIPLPGINPAALAQLSGTAVERISIFALGITPYVTILILAELLKVLAPGVRHWEQADARNRDKLNRAVVVLSLVAAAAQASGLALALEDVSYLVDERGTSFRLTCIATLVGATAIVIWLADLITRHGLGSGVWLLLVCVWIAALPSQIVGLFLRGPDSALSMELAIGWGLTALLLAAIVALIFAGARTIETVATCLWSVLLADSVWPWLILVIALIVGGGMHGAAFLMNPANPLALLVLAGLVALFAHLYIRSLRIAGTSVPAIAPNLLAAALAVIALVDTVIAMLLGFVVPISGHLIVIAAVSMSLLARWWQPPFEVKLSAGAEGRSSGAP